MLDVSLPHLTHPRGQRETSEKRDNSEPRNKSCQTVEFYYSNESYLTEINEPLRTFSCAHTLRKITSRGKREQPKKHLSQRLLLCLYFYNFKIVLESKTVGGGLGLGHVLCFLALLALQCTNICCLCTLQSPWHRRPVPSGDVAL